MRASSLNVFHRPSLVIQLAALVGMSACHDADTNDADQVIVSNAAELVNAPDLLKPEPTITRRELLDAVRDAASAHSTGVDDQASQSALAGRRFAIRIPFSCRSFQGGALKQSFSINRRPDGKSYEIVAAPNLSASEVGVSLSHKGAKGGNSADRTVEAVEGFWVPRPWMLADRCPVNDSQAATADDALGAADAVKVDVADPDATVKQAQGGSAVQVDYRTVGIAQYFTATDSRVARRMGRTYSKVVAIDNENGFPSNGLTLLLEGRLRAWPSGEVILCQGNGRNSPPSCVAGAFIDRVAFENPGDGSIIAEWRN